VIAVDADGSRAVVPAQLLTRLPGRRTPASLIRSEAALRTLEADAHLLATLAARGPSAARDELSLEAHGEALKREYESLLYMKAEVTASTV
jgi:hypothetical protein